MTLHSDVVWNHWVPLHVQTKAVLIVFATASGFTLFRALGRSYSQHTVVCCNINSGTYNAIGELLVAPVEWSQSTRVEVLEVDASTSALIVQRCSHGSIEEGFEHELLLKVLGIKTYI